VIIGEDVNIVNHKINLHELVDPGEEIIIKILGE
jgi:hypothetical protein